MTIRDDQEPEESTEESAEEQGQAPPETEEGQGDGFVFGVLSELPAAGGFRAEVYGQRGDAFYEAGLVDRAIEDYREAARLGRNAKWRRRVADSYFALGLPQQAYHAYKRAIRLDPKDPESHFFMGEFLRSMSRTFWAIEEFREALRLSGPDRPYYALKLGEACLAVGLMEDAVKALSLAARGKPGDSYYRFRLANALIRSGALADAVRQLEQAVRLSPCDDYYHALLAMAYKGSSRPHDALRAIRRAAEIRPKNRAYRHLVAEACQEAGLTTLSRRFRDLAGNLDEYDADYVDRLKNKVLGGAGEWNRPEWT